MSKPQQESNCIVHFRMEPVEFKAESEKAARPIFKEIPFITIIIPGDNKNVIDTKVTDYHKQKFPVAWQRFQAGLQDGGSMGTPLETWPQISRSQVKEANYFNITTVEQVAELSDSIAAKLGMGWPELKIKAKRYLNQANETADAKETQELKDQLAEQRAMIDELLANQKGKPGPKKKEPIAA